MTAPFDLPGVQIEKTNAGSQILRLSTPSFEAAISLIGGQLIEFRKHGEQPLLYLSPKATIERGRAIRGGVPVCWPWFGRHPGNDAAPQHGIARTYEWALQTLDPICNGFKLTLTGPNHGNLASQIRYTLNEQLLIELTTVNQGKTELRYSAALHTYLAISDATSARISGLANTLYVDKLTRQDGMHQENSLPCAGEIDRIVYTDHPLAIIDPGWSRQICVENIGSESAVIWNPGIDKAKSLSDLPDDDWRAFFCIESANAENDARTLAPGASHTLGTRILTIPL